jgi:hypothetical protein
LRYVRSQEWAVDCFPFLRRYAIKRQITPAAPNATAIALGSPTIVGGSDSIGLPASSDPSMMALEARKYLSDSAKHEIDNMTHTVPSRPHMAKSQKWVLRLSCIL